MAYQTKDLTGSLFKNNEPKNEKSPPYTGSCVIDGVPFWMNAWVNEAKDGQKYFSVKFKPKEAKPEQKPQGQFGNRPAASAALDDEIPF